MKKIFLFFILLLCCLPFAAYGLDVPRLQGYVNDYAGMISPSAKSKIEEELRAFEQSDSTQIVILTIPSLEGENIEEFSIKVAEVWKIGQQRKDNGVLFIVSKQERKIRIEVGRGLEGKLTDLMAGRIIDQVIKPRFKQGDFDGGFITGVSALIDGTRGEFKAEQRPVQRRQKGFPPFLTFLLFFGIFILILGSISRILGGIAGAIGLPGLRLSCRPSHRDPRHHSLGPGRFWRRSLPTPSLFFRRFSKGWFTEGHGGGFFYGPGIGGSLYRGRWL